VRLDADHPLAFSKGMRSCEVRPGFYLKTFNDPGFKGSPSIDVAGPHVFRETRKTDITPTPRSLIVSLAPI
jgi:hypothetical protein